MDVGCGTGQAAIQLADKFGPEGPRWRLSRACAMCPWPASSTVHDPPASRRPPCVSCSMAWRKWAWSAAQNETRKSKDFRKRSTPSANF